MKKRFMMWIAKKIYPYLKKVHYEEELNAWYFLVPDRLHLSDTTLVRGTPFFSIEEGSTMQVGENTVIISDDKLNTSAGVAASYFQVFNNARLIIGNNVGISNSSFTVREKIVIEDNVAIGSGCMITDNDFHSIHLGERMKYPDLDIKTSPVVIKKGAFIGARTIILKGVVIGEEAVIGAGSVVTCDIPSGEVWAGNPAKFRFKL